MSMIMNPPEAFPTIMSDIDLGNIFRESDIELPYLVDYLRAKGLSDDDINDLTVRFGADTDEIFSVDEETGCVKYYDGHYDPRSKSIRINLAAITVADYFTEGHHDDPVRMSRILGLHVADVIAHEVEHYVADVERDFIDVDSCAAMSLSGGAWDDDTYQAYLEHPEEKRARQTEGNYSADSVTYQ